MEENTEESVEEGAQQTDSGHRLLMLQHKERIRREGSH